MTAYDLYPRFLVSVDCVIFGFKQGKLQVLIHRRPYEPGKGELSLIGGFVQNDESLDDAAKRILTFFTGMSNVYMQQMSAYGEVERDPGERVISIVYYALVNMEEATSAIYSNAEAEWVNVDQLPHLCFDHNDMVEKARQIIGESFMTKPIGKYLMPRYFTLSLLQSLYESILGTQTDKRNFRRSVSYKDYIQATSMIDKGSSRRGATLYEYTPLH